MVISRRQYGEWWGYSYRGDVRILEFHRDSYIADARNNPVLTDVVGPFTAQDRNEARYLYAELAEQRTDKESKVWEEPRNWYAKLEYGMEIAVFAYTDNAGLTTVGTSDKYCAVTKRVRRGTKSQVAWWAYDEFVADGWGVTKPEGKRNDKQPKETEDKPMLPNAFVELVIARVMAALKPTEVSDFMDMLKDCGYFDDIQVGTTRCGDCCSDLPVIKVDKKFYAYDIDEKKVHEVGVKTTKSYVIKKDEPVKPKTTVSARGF